MKIILACITLLLSTFAASGLNRADTVKVFFRVGQSRLDPSFSGNGRAIESFETILRNAIAAGSVDSLVVRGYASPEGDSEVNQRLSRLRTQSVADYLVRNSGLAPSLIRAYPEGVAWDELRNLVAANPDVPDREEILDILDNVPLWIYGAGGKIVDGRKKRLMELSGGETYKWMLRDLFPQLRNSVAVAVYFTTPIQSSDSQLKVSELAEEVEVTDPDSDEVELSETSRLEEISEQITNLVSDTVPVSAERLEDLLSGTVQCVTAEKRKSFLMAVKTNMLYDAALIPNIGVEFSIGRSVSAYGEWMYAWWDNNPRHRFWRVYGGDLGVRWWFGRKARSQKLSGHHLGLYGGILTFDFEVGDYGYLGGKPGGTLWDRYLVNAGVEYGFSLPVADRLNIDFSLGLGYLGGNYIKYYPFDNDYYFDKEYKMRFFGPTKAEISLVWLIGPGYSKGRKGGGL